MRTSTTARADSPEGARSGASEIGSPKARDPLLAAICHDLRAPLAAVMMGANFVLQTTPEDEASGRSRRVLEAILRSCKQMERLVRDFGDLSEIEADAVALRVGVHEAGEMMEIAAETARPAAHGRSIRIEVSRPAEPLLVRCDRDRMLRAIGHVLDNAARFAPDGSVITADVRDEDGSAVFSVKDTGPGLSEETMDRLYDRVWHAKKADRTGAGLGLAIVRGFVLAHGGRVYVASDPGAGATFSLAIPKDAPG